MGIAESGCPQVRFEPACEVPSCMECTPWTGSGVSVAPWSWVCWGWEGDSHSWGCPGHPAHRVGGFVAVMRSGRTNPTAHTQDKIIKELWDGSCCPKPQKNKLCLGFLRQFLRSGNASDSGKQSDIFHIGGGGRGGNKGGCEKKWALRTIIFFLFIYLFSACRKQDRNSYHSRAESADTSPAFF